MRRPSFSAAFLAASALVAAFAAITAPVSAADEDTDAARDPVRGTSERGTFLDASMHMRPIDARPPFFGLRVHSMDVAAEAKRLASLEYAARRLGTGDWEKYQLVRTLFVGRAAPSKCDEVFGIVLPSDAGLRAEMTTTRWMRMNGPEGTPVGGFLGDLRIELVRDSLPDDVLLAGFRIAGTTGLRPMRGDPDDASKIDEGRCAAPSHDEGWYVGRLQRRVVRYLAEQAAEVGRGVDRETVQALERGILAGTFEGRLGFEPMPEAAAGADVAILPRWDYSRLAKGAWWFDGLLGYQVRGRLPQPEPANERNPGRQAEGARREGARRR